MRKHSLYLIKWSEKQLNIFRLRLRAHFEYFSGHKKLLYKLKQYRYG